MTWLIIKFYRQQPPTRVTSRDQIWAVSFYTCMSYYIYCDIFSDLSQKIMENCISEDDMEYFKLQDDTSLVQKSFFDLWKSVIWYKKDTLLHNNLIFTSKHPILKLWIQISASNPSTFTVRKCYKLEWRVEIFHQNKQSEYLNVYSEL